MTEQADGSVRNNNFEDGLSHITLCQRIEKTAENEYGFQEVPSIPTDEPVVLFLGGTGTETNKATNGNLSFMEELLEAQHIAKGSFGIYGVQYYFGENYQPDLARMKLFADYSVPQILSDTYYYKFTPQEMFLINKRTHKRKGKPVSSETNDPNYIKELFNQVFLPRLCDENGQKLPVDEAKKRLRNLTVCAHCHGAYTFLKVEEMMQAKMAEVGFSPEERADIQKQLLCLAWAPDTPFGVSKSTMVSFACNRDPTLLIRNNFRRFMTQLDKYQFEEYQRHFSPAYFPGERGEVFLAEHFDEDGTYNHEIGTLENPTKERELFLIFLSKAIVNSLTSAQKGEPIPSVKELVCGEKEKALLVFDFLEKEGNIYWNVMTTKGVLKTIITAPNAMTTKRVVLETIITAQRAYDQKQAPSH